MTTILDSEAALEALYGQALPRALAKEIDRLSDHYRAFIDASPFVVMATVGPEGLDCSPRGDPPGFVAVEDDRTLLLPDRRGNNRLDSLRNLIRDPHISLLFLIPGIGETLRVNGTAEIDTDPSLCARFEMDGKVPKSVIRIRIGRVYYQCQKALARSHLWDASRHVPRETLPSAGEMLEALSKEPFDGASYDAGYPDYMKKTIY